MTEKSDILLLGSDNPTTWIVYNRLVREFGLFDAIIEKPVARRVLLKNRMRKIGLARVLSQMAFVVLIRPFLLRRDGLRIRELSNGDDLEPYQPMTPAITHVENINSESAVAAIKSRAPRIIIVNGTRILKPHVLAAVPAIFINTHQGITPQYRGAHGAYWALYRKDPDNCGVTIHVVDAGIDTGSIVEQMRIAPSPRDSFVTYPYLQTAAALPVLVRTVQAARAGTVRTTPPSGPSAIWYHPGLVQYLAATRRGVR